MLCAVCLLFVLTTCDGGAKTAGGPLQASGLAGNWKISSALINGRAVIN